jgi:RNA polymerase sigma-70 factor (ECF subfamily)
MAVDHGLIRRAQQGDEAAFNQLVAQYRRRILGTVARVIGRPEDVEDVGQEVFVRLFYSLEQLRSPEVFEPWLYRLTQNACFDYLRRRKRRNESRMSDLTEQQVLLADADAAGDARLEEERKASVREFTQELLNEVSDDDRMLLVLKEVEGLSIKELEDIYGVNENAIKVRLFRARQRVLRAFERKSKPGEAAPAS